MYVISALVVANCATRCKHVICLIQLTITIGRRVIGDNNFAPMHNKNLDLQNRTAYDANRREVQLPERVLPRDEHDVIINSVIVHCACV